MGIIRLAGPIVVKDAKPVNLSKSIPPVGDQVSLVGALPSLSHASVAHHLIALGYGGPDFFSLGATVNTVVLESREIDQSGSPAANTKLVFVRDARTGISPNMSQAGALISFSQFLIVY